MEDLPSTTDTQHTTKWGTLHVYMFALAKCLPRLFRADCGSVHDQKYVKIWMATPFEPSQRNYSKFKKVNDAIDGLPYHHYILPKLPQWVDFSKRAITYSRKNYDGIKWKAGTADIVINHWLNHLEHPDNVATCSRTSCTCTGGSTTQS